MKRMIAIITVLLAGLWMTLPVQAEDAEFDGYLVKLREDIPMLLSGEASDGLLVVETLDEAEQIPAEYVEYIEPNYYLELFDDIAEDWQPNDEYYAEYQAALQAIDGLGGYRHGLTGKGVRVGFVDSGVNVEHEDLNEENISGINYNADGQPYSVDNYGHGTFVAGIVAAVTDNQVGLAGIAPDVEIRAYRVFSQKKGTMANVVAAIRQAIDDECQILSLSLGTSIDSPTLRTAVQEALDAGVVVVAAVGNSGNEVLQYPAAYEGVIGVGSVDPRLNVSSFSQKNKSVFVTAPGEEIAGLSNSAADGYLLDLTSSQNRGTSYAAPVVTAMAALALEYDPELTSDEVAEMLRLTATDLGETGYDTSYGYGIVNVSSFLQGFEGYFSMIYQLSGGTFLEEPSLCYPAEEGLAQLPLPVCEGHNFVGWYADADKTVLVEQIPAGTWGKQTLYAKWEANGEGFCRDQTGDGDHACDICGADGASSCEDPDRDHTCDECGFAVGSHEAAEGTHACDYCGETMTECADGDKNHICDICGAAVGNHEAAEGTHTCGHCGETMTECADSEDLDTQCDICGKNLLQIRVEGGLLVVENNANIQLIIAEYDVYGKMLGVHIVTESANVPICGQTRVFTLDKSHVPLLPWLEVNTDSTAVQ